MLQIQTGEQSVAESVALSMQSETRLARLRVADRAGFAAISIMQVLLCLLSNVLVYSMVYCTCIIIRVVFS